MVGLSGFFHICKDQMLVWNGEIDVWKGVFNLKFGLESWMEMILKSGKWDQW